MWIFKMSTKCELCYTPTNLVIKNIAEHLIWLQYLKKIAEKSWIEKHLFQISTLVIMLNVVDFITTIWNIKFLSDNKANSNLSGMSALERWPCRNATKCLKLTSLHRAWTILHDILMYCCMHLSYDPCILSFNLLRYPSLSGTVMCTNQCLTHLHNAFL